MTIKQLKKALRESNQDLKGKDLARRIAEIRAGFGTLEDVTEARR